MAIETVQWALLALAVYLAFGVAVAVPFVVVGVGRTDPAARGSGALFRVLIAPGCCALWPIVLAKWIRGRDAAPTREVRR